MLRCGEPKGSFSFSFQGVTFETPMLIVDRFMIHRLAPSLLSAWDASRIASVWDETHPRAVRPLMRSVRRTAGLA